MQTMLYYKEPNNLSGPIVEQHESYTLLFCYRLKAITQLDGRRIP